MYLAKNQDKYNFYLSSSDFMLWSGIGSTAYTSAFNELVDHGYMIPKEGSKTVYTFFDKAQKEDPKEKMNNIIVEYDPDTVKATDENFKEKYVGAGKMVHWADVADHVKGDTIILRSLMIDKNEIPKEYHYVVIAWYDKVATSGLDENIIARFEDSLFAYLRSINVSEEDLATIVIRGYTGNVGPTCGQIMEDDDVDIMLGWGSADNVTSTGGMDPAMLLETVTGYAVGAKNRTLHRLTESESVLTVMEWLKSDECRAIFA
jgi:hypothetical protein